MPLSYIWSNANWAALQHLTEETRSWAKEVWASSVPAGAASSSLSCWCSWKAGAQRGWHLPLYPVLLPRSRQDALCDVSPWWQKCCSAQQGKTRAAGFRGISEGACTPRNSGSQLLLLVNERSKPKARTIWSCGSKACLLALSGTLEV